MTSSRPAKRFWSNLGVRAVSAVVLAAVAIAAVWFGGELFLLVLSVSTALLAIEWGGMSASRAPLRVSLTIMVGILAALFAAYLGHYYTAWVLVAVAALVAGLVARGIAERPELAAYGVVYLAPAIIALWWLRAHDPDYGRGWTTLLLAVTWAADIGAFLVGSWLKGPKLWPRLSPKKTWAGFLGGLAFAVVAAMAVRQISSLHEVEGSVTLPIAAGIGLAGGLATMAGDLWESMLKRRFGVKDSGDLIPGHGGLMDRVDGLMFAIMVVAAIRMLMLYLG
jgi:phosphatidate cytidylyltransferase